MSFGLLSNPQIKQLYSRILKEAEHFPQYNFRQYFLRKYKTEFEGSKELKTDAEVATFLQSGEKQLSQLRRMTAVANLYSSEDKLVIEKNHKDLSE